MYKMDYILITVYIAKLIFEKIYIYNLIISITNWDKKHINIINYWYQPFCNGASLNRIE